MRYALVLVLLACAGCPESGKPAGKLPSIEEESGLPTGELKKRLESYRVRVEVLEQVIAARDQAALVAKARWAGAGFLALAVLLAVLAFYLGVARKTLLIAAVCCGLVGGGCLLFAWLVPYLLPIGVGLAVLFAVVGAYLVRASAADRQEAFAITARVAQKLGGEGEAATRKALLFLEELAASDRLSRAQLKRLRDEVLPKEAVNAPGT